jgi:hypothetical protein
VSWQIELLKSPHDFSFCTTQATLSSKCRLNLPNSILYILLSPRAFHYTPFLAVLAASGVAAVGKCGVASRVEEQKHFDREVQARESNARREGLSLANHIGIEINTCVANTQKSMHVLC